MKSKFIGLLICAVCFIAASTFASDQDVGQKTKSEIVTGDAMDLSVAYICYDVATLESFNIDSKEISAVNPAPMFKSPSENKCVTSRYRRARDGLSCTGHK